MLTRNLNQQIIYEGQQLIAAGSYTAAIKLLSNALDPKAIQTISDPKESLLVFNVYRLLYEATCSICSNEQSKIILDELYTWAKKCHEELFGRLELLEFKIRTIELTPQNSLSLLSEYEQLMSDCLQSKKYEEYVWAANKFFKLIPYLDHAVAYDVVLTESLEYARKLGLVEAEMWIRFHVGLIQVKHNQLDQAEKSFTEGLNKAYEINQKEGIKWLSYNLGKLYFQQPAKKDLASRYFAQAINIYYQTESPAQQQNILKQYLPEIFSNLTETNRLAIVSRSIVSEIHELKNLLTANKLALSNLSEQLHDLGIKDDYVNTFLSSLQNSQKDILAKVKSILSFASGNQEQQNKKVINLFEYLHNFISMVQPVVKEANHELIFAIDAHTSNIQIEVNELILTQSLLNLVFNAVEAMNTPNGKITISTNNLNGKCTIEVADSGQGIPEKVLAHLFQPFNTSKPQGTGIGLYATKELLNKNDMDIHLVDTSAQGTRFSVVVK